MRAIPIFIIAVGIGVAIMFAFALVGIARRGVAIASAPTISLPATVVTKRIQNRSDSGSGYFATFEVRGGERIELHVRGDQYGQLVEGDRGLLTHKGPLFQGFDRGPQDSR